MWRTFFASTAKGQWSGIRFHELFRSIEGKLYGKIYDLKACHSQNKSVTL